mgnify:CR=1 FL=1
MMGELAGYRLLLVEDEFLVARHIMAVLRQLGAVPVGPVPDVTGAQAALARETVDAALLDIRLAAGDVFAFADALAEQGVPFVFVTGYDGAQLPARFAGRPLVEKPVEAPELCAGLCRVLPAAPADGG